MKTSASSKCVVCLLLSAAVCGAQTGTGNIQGTVTDATGAVVPGAKVTITQTRTSLSTTTTTNEVGFYLFPAVQLGPYRMAVEAAGMERWQGELTLMAGQSAEVNVSLKVGVTATEVTIVGNVTPLLTTTDPTLATVIERTRVEQLPLNGRFVTDLVLATTPGIVSGGYNNGVTIPRVNGLRYAAEMVQDGSVLSNREWNSLPDRLPGIDSIEEFRTETNNSSAKMNRPGTIILTTRAGTNTVHGAIFETARNSGLGVARRRQDYYLKAPHLVRNEFGASLGGPVFLPKLYNGRNKTFFFFAWEGYRLRQASTISASMPTAAMRQGDFSGLVDGQGRRYTLYDPLTTDSKTWQRQAFPNNQIPITRESPLAKYLLSVTPLPNTADNPMVTSNWFGASLSNTDQATVTTRIDHRISEMDQVFFRYSRNPSTAMTTGQPMADNRGNVNVVESSNWTAVVNWTHTFSPTFFSETIFPVQFDDKAALPGTGYEDVSSALGLPNPFKGIGFPRMTNNGFGNQYTQTNPYIDYSVIPSIDENLTKIKGRHEFQFGARLRREYINILPDQQEKQGFVDFGSRATALYDPKSGSAYSSVPYTGHNAANLFLGIATYSARFTRGFFHFRASETAAYFQDNFKVNSRLTLNLGLRYEYNSPVRERDNTLIGFDTKTHAVVLPRPLNDFIQRGLVLPALADAYAAQGHQYITPDQAGQPASMVYSNKWDFNPRAGFAYRLGPASHPLVLRGGYSIFSFGESIRLFSSSMRANVPSTGQIANNPNLAEQSPDGLPNYLLRSVPTIIAGLNSANALDITKVTGISRGAGAMYFFDPDFPTARAHEWNFTLEREVLSKITAKFSYVGTHGARTTQHASLNDAPNDYIWYVTTGLPKPTGEYAAVAMRLFDREKWGTIRRVQKTGWSNYNALTFDLERRYAGGYGFQVFYVMSNALRAGGDGWRDDILQPVGMYLPGIVPTDDKKRNRFMFYRRDTAIPKHRMNWNWILDLPFGKGKRFGRNTGGFANALIGGWQIAGLGSLVSRYFQLPTGNWGPVGELKVYGKKYPIQDCRSGICYDGWLYWNGYIPANRINSYDQNGKPNGVMGVPDSYFPLQAPLIPTPKGGGSPADPLYPFYDTNTVWVPLKNGTVQRTTYNAGVHPLQNQFVLGPMIWNMSASLFKSVQIRERMFLRFNADFLDNVFNMPGTTMPGSDGIILNRDSANPPRVLQLTLRLSW